MSPFLVTSSIDVSASVVLERNQAVETGLLCGLVTYLRYYELSLDQIMDPIASISKYSFGELLTDVPSFFLRVFLLHCRAAENKQTLFVVTAAQKTFSRSEFPIAQINHITDFIGTIFLVQCCANAKFIFFWRELRDFAK